MTNADISLYRALSMEDLPAAWLLGEFSSHKTYEGDNAAAAFNRGLCLFLLEEYESALSELKRAERLSNSAPELDSTARNMFAKALDMSGDKLALIPLDPNAPEASKGLARYVLIRTKWLSALCLKALGRNGETAMLTRFLTQYNINL